MKPHAQHHHEAELRVPVGPLRGTPAVSSLSVMACEGCGPFPDHGMSGLGPGPAPCSELCRLLGGGAQGVSPAMLFYGTLLGLGEKEKKRKT